MILSEDIRKHKFTTGDKLFLDTNVWIFINCSVKQQSKEDKPKVKAYSSALNRAYKAESRIYINAFVISEYVHAYATLMWRKRIKSEETSEKAYPFKKFRNSPHFEKEAGKEIARSAHNEVLIYCSLINERFEPSDVIDFVDKYAQGKMDFTDHIIRRTCENEGLNLITDDRDFAGQGIPLLTANPRLLN